MSDKPTATDVNLAHETSLGTIAKFATLIVGFVGSIVFARILGPAGYGGFFLLLAVVQIVEKGANGWVAASKKRFSEDTTEETRREIVGASLGGVFLLIIFCIAVAVIFSDELASYVGITEAVLPFVALLVGMVLYSTYRDLTDARGLVSISNWGEALQTIFAFPIQLGLVLAGLGVIGMAYGYAIGFLLVVPLFAYYVDVRPSVPSRSVVTRLWEFAKYSIPSGLLGRVYTRVDVILLGIILGQTAAGYYEVAYRITIPATFVSAVAAPAIMSRTSELSSQNESFGEDLRNGLAYASVLAIPIFFGAVVLSKEIVVTLYGPEYTQAAVLLVGLSFYRIMSSQGNILLNVIQGADQPHLTFRLALITIGVNIPLGVILTLEYGAIGVVIATVVAETLRYLGAIMVLQDWVTFRELFPRQIGHQMFAASSMAVMIWVITRVIQIRSWQLLVIVVGIGAAMYGLVLLGVSEQHRTLVTDVLSGFGIAL